MKIEQKAEILNRLDTKNLIQRLAEYEDKLDKALKEEASFKDLNYGYLSGAGDCAEVKRINAELVAQVPDTDDKEKKLTAPQKEAWLLRQRTDDKELSGAIAQQKDVAFNLDNFRINIEMAKKRLEGTRAVIGLRTAQIRFLSDSE